MVKILVKKLSAAFYRFGLFLSKSNEPHFLENPVEQLFNFYD